MSSSNHTGKHSLRIIGGNWRGRKVSFANTKEIRPSPDRVRETLFNWLQGEVQGALCLELYAGSGILSLEALSRGARQVVLIDKMKLTVRHLSEVFSGFSISGEHYQIFNMSAHDWLEEDCAQKFNIVFIDPPFAVDEYLLILDALVRSDLLDSAALVYIESAAPVLPCQIPKNWEIYRQKKAGSVHYCLCRVP